MKTQQTLGNFFSMGTLALYFLLMTLLTQGGEGASIQPSCKLSKPSLMQYFISNQIFSLAQLASLSDNDTSTRLLERYMFNQVEDTNRCYLMKEILDLTLKSMSPVPQPKFQPYLRDVLPFFNDQKNKLASCTLKGNGRLVRKQMDDLKNKLKRLGKNGEIKIISEMDLLLKLLQKYCI
ncbi:interleukin-22 [Notamacropus eugenii]|uniref:interleukin-22 n=1 Tax=Notamacropus eugenii TaxID=9315 RepID=UPI003B680208